MDRQIRRSLTNFGMHEENMIVSWAIEQLEEMEKVVHS